MQMQFDQMARPNFHLAISSELGVISLLTRMAKPGAPWEFGQPCVMRRCKNTVYRIIAIHVASPRRKYPITMTGTASVVDSSYAFEHTEAASTAAVATPTMGRNSAGTMTLAMCWELYERMLITTTQYKTIIVMAIHQSTYATMVKEYPPQAVEIWDATSAAMVSRVIGIMA